MNRLNRRRRGFTLVELLVVISIILIVSVAALPVVLPAIQSQGVSSAALLLNAELSRARDESVRSGTGHGIRLIPERDGRFAWGGVTPAYTRMIAIEPGPDYSEGYVNSGDSFGFTESPAGDLRYNFPPLSGISSSFGARLVAGGPVFRTWHVIVESKVTTKMIGGVAVTVPNPPTSWYWNIRQGDKIRFDDSGRVYTIVGPMLAANPERFINWGLPGSNAYSLSIPGDITNAEFLILLDGQDGNGNGYVDEEFDGLDNDNNGNTDPGFGGAAGVVSDPTLVLNNSGGEWEDENVPTTLANKSYTILRRPVASSRARELALPSGVVIDMTTWNAPYPGYGGVLGAVPERSRLPVDPNTGYVDIMMAPNGQIVQPGAGPIKAMDADVPFLHFWIADADDVLEPLSGVAQPWLPFPANTPNYTPTNAERVLKRNRRLVSINTRTGQITTATLDVFDLTGLTAANTPLVLGRAYRQAEAGVKDQP